MVSDRGDRALAIFSASLGAPLTAGGIAAAGALNAITLEVGLIQAWGASVLAEPSLYIFAGFATAFLILAGPGVHLGSGGYQTLSGRPGRSDR